MKKIFDLLDTKEKRILGLLCVLLAGVVLFLVLVSLPQRRNYFFALSSLTTKKENYQQLNEKNLDKKGEWLRWQEARHDMDELRTEYFYDDKEGLQQIRLDLQQIFSDTRIFVSRIKYNYSENKTEEVKKVNVSFNLKGSYVLLKKFINSVEMFPKFLVIEKIDFLDIDTVRGELELNIILAGYYET